MRKSQLALLSHQNENLSTEVAGLRKELRNFGEAFVILSDSLRDEFASLRTLVMSQPVEIVESDVELAAAQIEQAVARTPRTRRAPVRKAAPKT